MSKQISLFWGDSDDEVVFDILRTALGDFSVVAERGTAEELVPRRVADLETFHDVKEKTSNSRFYLAFTEDENLTRKYDLLVRRLKKRATRIPQSKFMWSMPSASQYKFLRDGITKFFFDVDSGAWRRS